VKIEQNSQPSLYRIDSQSTPSKTSKKWASEEVLAPRQNCYTNCAIERPSVVFPFGLSGIFAAFVAAWMY
jgi:hypothetical protein